MLNSCKVCRSTELQKIGLKNKKIFYSCSNCKFITLDRYFYVTPEEEKNRYRAHNNSYNNGGYVKVLKELIDFGIKPYEADTVKVLDYGCGPKPVLKNLLISDGYDVRIFDKYFFPDSTYREEKYDIIVLNEVMEHLKDPVSVLGDLKNILMNSGKLIISTLFQPDDKVKFINWWYKNDYTHVSFFNIATFNWIAAIVGFTLIRTNKKNLIVFEKKQ